MRLTRFTPNPTSQTTYWRNAMAFIVTDTKQMAEMLQNYISTLQHAGDSGQMLILPIMAATTPEDTLMNSKAVE